MIDLLRTITFSWLEGFPGFFESGGEDHLVRVFFECGVYGFFVLLDVVGYSGVREFQVGFFELCPGVEFCDVVAVDLSSVYYDR
jgi:hypothetical protein